MGNNNSQQPPPSSVDVVRRPPSRPNAPPSARPISDLGPRGPSYYSPENQVLPKELPSILKLRPVSMELSKYNPDFQDIYAQESKENLDDNENKIEMNGNIGDNTQDIQKASSPPRPPPPVQNGHIPPDTPLSPVSQLPNGQIQTSAKPSTSSAKGPYRPSHRRQMSLGEKHVILEEPEESIESRVKLDPLMQSFPGATGPSLPVKNNFNLDYSYQLTYVQLAEHRRSKTIEELEKKTGKKLSDLSADLSEHTEKPAFSRDAPSRVSSRSSGSGVSSKKKRAPAPPGQAPPPPPSSPPANHQPYSVDNEPPVDYDIESPRRPTPSSVVLPRYSSLPPVSRVVPSVSMVPPPPPPPPGSSPRKPAVNLSRTPSMSNGTPEIILRKTPDVKPVSKDQESSDGKIPWLLEIKNLSEVRAARRQQSQEASETPEIQQSDSTVNDMNEAENSPQVESKDIVKPKLVFESSTDTFAIKQENESKSVERSNSFKEAEKPAAAKLLRHHSTTGYDHATAAHLQRQTSEPAKPITGDPVRRLSSLLQHDIKAAANAKCHKIVKQTTPVPPKPKDPHTVFREQLQKACAARDERAKSEGTIDEKLKLNSSNASFDMENDENEITPKYNTTPRKEKTESNVKEGPNTLPKPPRYHKNVTMNRNSSYNRVQRGNSTEKSPRENRDRQAVSMSLDWTPEDDLDSDDNLSDREVMTRRLNSTDGFKSTIIPNTMTDMKTKKKKGKNSQKENGPSDEQNKNKFGSVRKLKKSVHKSVKNAFGSISKASGKILRRQRSEDFEAVEDAPKNWSMTANANGQGDRSHKYRIPLSYEQDEDTDSDIEPYNHDHEFSEVVFRQNGRNDSEESSDSTYESEDKAPQNIKRAGVAYISAKGQLVLMKDEDEEEMIEKLKKKDKKKKSKDRNTSADRSSEELWEKERKQEEERRKQLEMELEMHKRREAETRERLQRLENAHLQQQLLQQQQQQQQQQQNLGVLTAPPLPPAGSFPGYGTLPDPARAQTQGFTNIFGQQLPQNGYQTNFGLYSQTGTYNPVTSMPYDLNDYMRMLGVQTPPTSQQMAFFLNNMTLAGQPLDRKSNPALLDMFNQQYPNGTMNYGVDTSLKKSAFQNWASTPNINVSSSVANSVPLNDFVASYNGANNKNNEKDDAKVKSRNPLYDSDDSDGGLSPQKTVARAQVKDYRKLPVRTESGKFMKKYGSETYITQNNQDTQNTFSDTNKSLARIPYDEGHPQQQRSVSPSNSVSTVDSAMSATSVTLSTPSSPSRSTGAPASPTLISRSHNSAHGFKTVLDLTSPEGGSMQIISTNGDPVKL
ncbi:serine/arginine repetitive matrix protein 1-like [Mercenaria mercenaria]|uniref:serine/arginine repetitive matrix protein 1-like n=1 Tax=Mercenaria mercenaria TaxID=6596 RepID=UPI00234E7DB9|nr:serine/arginine repetitive matrix protein 1-like [Mercenaria mercenaria]XP_053384075.1 serine/arginine repetitive matrix protein 1-like [Mercenaria mercenaria]XP_053384076.1 serine/arginine repetitive matrix protein 1-like [Mercenaria mercenaria]XP_053384077.1 serine/arginine repetitive matrix protein 1-like [Mercenaria mercenaria]XP_053384079.1 serine/arginine repetitive matrix protein 1-like [Mercenaria mercenaria]XP_053384080.1 serine/arginine repetitive matrix protein 1-like [Mercenaria